MPSAKEIGGVLEQARKAAVDYYRLTGKPLGITGEIGEYEPRKRSRVVNPEWAKTFDLDILVLGLPAIAIFIWIFV